MSDRVAQIEIIVFKIVNNEILFLLLKRSEARGGFWQPITGGAHPGEIFTDTVKRELEEETKIKEYLRLIENVHYFEYDGQQYGIVKEFVFGVEIAPDTEIKISDEHTEMKWCSLDESLQLLKYESNKTSFKKLYHLLTT